MTSPDSANGGPPAGSDGLPREEFKDTASVPVHRDAGQPQHGSDSAAPVAHRATSYARDPYHAEQSFATEDSRWTRSAQLRDWAKLAIAMALFLGWTMVVYFLEPGLR